MYIVDPNQAPCNKKQLSIYFIQSINVHCIPSSKQFYFVIDIDPRKASKQFSTRFSCGSSVTGEDEVVVQGDLIDDMISFILEHWPEVHVIKKSVFDKQNWHSIGPIQFAMATMLIEAVCLRNSQTYII